MQVCPNAVLLLLCAFACASCLVPSANDEEPWHTGRIMGGRPISIRDLPFVTSLHAMGKYKCVATIVKTHWALTAGHCISYHQRPGSVALMAGSTMRDSGGDYYPMDRTVRHHENELFEKDIAALFTHKGFRFGELVKPALMSVSDPLSTAVLKVAGWGRKRKGGRLPTKLQTIYVKEHPRLKCKETYWPLKITQLMLCIGPIKAGLDLCQGDSGAPLVDEKLYYGIMSAGTCLGDPNKPAIFTSITGMIEWIVDVTTKPIYYTSNYTSTEM